jgi:hypothetical protein
VEIAAFAISKRSWERWKACRWLSTVSTTRHFHGPSISRRLTSNQPTSQILPTDSATEPQCDRQRFLADPSTAERLHGLSMAAEPVVSNVLHSEERLLVQPFGCERYGPIHCREGLLVTGVLLKNLAASVNRTPAKEGTPFGQPITLQQCMRLSNGIYLRAVSGDELGG